MGHLHQRIALLLGLTTALFSQSKEPLRYSIIGSIDTSRSPNYFGVMNEISLQKFFLTLAKSAMPESAVHSALKGTRTGVKELLDLGLIRKVENEYFLNFALFTVEDQKRVIEVIDPYAESLSKALLVHQKEITSVLASYDAEGVDRKALAFLVLGCASLDWDGLQLTEDKGYRAVTGHKPDGEYVPHAEENGDISIEKIYWGSRTNSYKEISFTTFGDDVSKRLTPPKEFAEPICRIMLSLRESPKTIKELAMTPGITPLETDGLLPILLAYDWVVESAGRYRIKIPVFTTRDEAMIKKILAIGNQVMDMWLKENYQRLKLDMKSMSYTRSGVAFEEGFTMIWHYLFGLANKKLVAAGLFADPYAVGRKFKGSFPVIYDAKKSSFSPP